jgi:hypothetical protein
MRQQPNTHTNKQNNTETDRTIQKQTKQYRNKQTNSETEGRFKSEILG